MKRQERAKGDERTAKALEHGQAFSAKAIHHRLREAPTEAHCHHRDRRLPDPPQQFVRETIESNESWGGMKIFDPVLQKTWILKLGKIDPKTLKRRGKDHFIMCAELISKSNPADLVDLDFGADWEGHWSLERVKIHKVNGKPRFYYNAGNEPVPVKK